MNKNAAAMNFVLVLIVIIIRCGVPPGVFVVV